MRINVKERYSNHEQNSLKCSLDKKSPRLISRIFFCWILRLYYYGNRRNLDEHDLVPPKKIFDAKHLGDLLERNWLKEEAAAKIAGHKSSLVKVIFKTFFCAFVPTMIMQFLYVFLRTTTPLLFGELLQYWSPSSPIDRVVAIHYAIGMILGNLAAAFFYNHGSFSSYQCAIKIKVAISSLVFRKILRMNKTSLEESKAGKIVNMLSNDLQRFDTTLLSLNYIWILPLQAIGVCYFGYLRVGYAVFIGLAASALITLQLSFSSSIGKSRSKAAKKTDERTQLMNEVISGIRVIKMYAWEIPFKNLVQSKRDEEVNELRRATYMKSTILGFIGFAEKATLFVTILAFVLLGNPMSANVIFPLQQFMIALQIGLTYYLPTIVTSIAEMRVSINRLQDFLSLDDRPDLAPRGEAPAAALFRHKNTKKNIDKKVTALSYHNTDSLISKGFIRQNPLRRSLSFPNDLAVVVREVSASWRGDSSNMVLRNVSLQLQKGKLCAVIGVVGSGKSSLLQLLLKELPALSGSITVNGSISYASQDAWLFASSVRENIIFGLPYDVHKYMEICKACALQNDFLQFPHGDQSLVGERGVTLSGGQRARINLARALYREADIYILDDPLSAVDANVGRQLFEGCINGYLRGRTRVLVTHQIHYLQAVDQIIVLNEGRVEKMGSYDELASSGKEFTMLLATLQENDNKLIEKPDILNNLGTNLTRQLSQRRVPLEEFEIQKVQEEDRQYGHLKWEVIEAYFRSGGKMCAATFLMVFLVAFCGASADFWMTYWTNQMANYEKGLHGAEMDSSLELRVGQFTTGQYLIIYGCIIASCIVLTQLRVMTVVSLCMSASRKLHNLMFSTVIAGIMRFFDKNLSGRILNRFTKDIGELDESVPRTLWLVFQLYSTLLAMIALNAIALYWSLIPSIFMLLIFYFTVKMYMRGAQDVKRLEGTTKSPVFGMITSSLNGMSTIRSAGAQQRLIEEFDISQDINTTAYNCYLGGVSALGLYLDILCIIYVTCIVFIFLFIDIESIDVGNVGLVITQGYTLMSYLQHGARTLVELLAQLISVERVLEYTRIDTEQDLFQGKMNPPRDWPSAGTIEFRGVYLRYDTAEAPVLKDLNFVIRSGWKVGIVGRTGAGKSSLISALFRLYEVEGMIAIDGLDTSFVSRQELRSKISIIPQEPVLFPATIRYNLDPFNIYSDDQIWRALEQVELKSAISSLDFKVSEGGCNFSVGQRQLLCLARAILRSNKILIMDEATANVDPQTDHFIQKTIRRLCSSCTVLTIAHRLNTVMDSDRVLVMGNGRLLEFDHPHILLSNSHSRLAAMVRETGDNIKLQLHNMAEQSYRKSKSQITI